MALSPLVDSAKARGAFYTPPSLANFLTKWAIRTPEDRTLEPACGDGVFMQTAVEAYRALGRAHLRGYLYGIELEAGEARKARLIAPDAEIRSADFFSVLPSMLPKFDSVIGNPPYIRYHGFTGDQRARGLARAKEQGLALSNLSSSWAHFVAHSASFLREGGRLALVLPAELLHTDYAEPVRKWLLDRFGGVTVVTFDRATFANAQVDAVLLLADPSDPKGLRVIRVSDASALDALVPSAAPTIAEHRTRWSGSIHPEASALYDDFLATGARRLGEIASVDIGVVTGANKFFILAAEETRRLRIPNRYVVPIVEAAGQLGGLAVRPRETKRLLVLTKEPTSKRVKAYLARGVKDGVALGYKCRSRTPWYRVPLPRSRPHLLMPYMSNVHPRLYVNRLRTWSTNLVHGITLRTGAPDARALSAASLSAAVMLSAEIEGRAYGGGVLKLETKEAERLAFPSLGEVAIARLVEAHAELDRMVRRGATEEASAMVDAVLGLDHGVYREAAETYRRRRLGRRMNPGT